MCIFVRARLRFFSRSRVVTVRPAFCAVGARQWQAGPWQLALGDCDAGAGCARLYAVALDSSGSKRLCPATREQSRQHGAPTQSCVQHRVRALCMCHEWHQACCMQLTAVCRVVCSVVLCCGVSGKPPSRRRSVGSVRSSCALRRCRASCSRTSSALIGRRRAGSSVRSICTLCCSHAVRSQRPNSPSSCRAALIVGVPCDRRMAEGPVRFLCVSRSGHAACCHARRAVRSRCMSVWQ